MGADVKGTKLRIKYIELMQKAQRKDETLLECHVRVFEYYVDKFVDVKPSRLTLRTKSG